MASSWITLPCISNQDKNCCTQMIFNIKLKDNAHNYLVDMIKQSLKKSPSVIDFWIQFSSTKWVDWWDVQRSKYMKYPLVLTTVWGIPSLNTHCFKPWCRWSLAAQHSSLQQEMHNHTNFGQEQIVKLMQTTWKHGSISYNIS